MTTENKLKWIKCADSAREVSVFQRVETAPGSGYFREEMVVSYRVEAHGDIAADGQSRIFRGYKCAHIPPDLPHGMIGGLLRSTDEPIGENNPAHDAFIFDSEEDAQAAAQKHFNENFGDIEIAKAE